MKAPVQTEVTTGVARATGATAVIRPASAMTSSIAIAPGTTSTSSGPQSARVAWGISRSPP